MAAGDFSVFSRPKIARAAPNPLAEGGKGEADTRQPLDTGEFCKTLWIFGGTPNLGIVQGTGNLGPTVRLEAQSVVSVPTKPTSKR